MSYPVDAGNTIRPSGRVTHALKCWATYPSRPLRRWRLSRKFPFFLILYLNTLSILVKLLNAYFLFLSKCYFENAMTLHRAECFDRHVNILTGNNIDFAPVSGRSDLPQSQPISGTLDPDAKDVIINFQAYCCVLQDCFPVHPPSRKPIPRKRPATYKYIGFLQWILVHKTLTFL